MCSNFFQLLFLSFFRLRILFLHLFSECNGIHKQEIYSYIIMFIHSPLRLYCTTIIITIINIIIIIITIRQERRDIRRKMKWLGDHIRKWVCSPLVCYLRFELAFACTFLWDLWYMIFIHSFIWMTFTFPVAHHPLWKISCECKTVSGWHFAIAMEYCNYHRVFL